MENRPEAAYKELIQKSREIGLVASCSAVLSWDEQTYMPSGGAATIGANRWHFWPVCTMTGRPNPILASCSRFWPGRS